MSGQLEWIQVHKREQVHDDGELEQVHGDGDNGEQEQGHGKRVLVHVDGGLEQVLNDDEPEVEHGGELLLFHGELLQEECNYAWELRHGDVLQRLREHDDVLELTDDEYELLRYVPDDGDVPQDENSRNPTPIHRPKHWLPKRVTGISKKIKQTF